VLIDRITLSTLVYANAASARSATCCKYIGTRLERLRHLQALGLKAQCPLNASTSASTFQIVQADRLHVTAKALATSRGNQSLPNPIARNPVAFFRAHKICQRLLFFSRCGVCACCCFFVVTTTARDRLVNDVTVCDAVLANLLALG